MVASCGTTRTCHAAADAAFASKTLGPHCVRTEGATEPASVIVPSDAATCADASDAAAAEDAAPPKKPRIDANGPPPPPLAVCRAAGTSSSSSSGW